MYFDNGILAFFGFAAHQLVAFLDAVDMLDLRPRIEGFEGLMGVFIADSGDHRLNFAMDGPGFVAELCHFSDDFFDFFQREIGL